jgi:putative ABC transport system permease protein
MGTLRGSRAYPSLVHSRGSLREAVFVAAGSLRSSKLRSFLTLLGIILATTTLIAVMSVIHGMDVYVAQQVSDMGGDGFRVLRLAMIGRFDAKKYLEMQRRNPKLQPEEFDFLRAGTRLCRDIGMEASRSVPLHYEKQNVDGIRLRGVTPNMGVITNTQTALGRFFTDSDNRRRLPVAFIGNDIRDKFFPNLDPVGKTLYLQGRPFKVIGTAKTQGSVFGQSRDNFVMIPIQTFFKMFGNRVDIGFFGVALDHETIYQAQDEIRVLLRSYRHLSPKQEDTFSIVGSESLTSAWDKLTGAIAITAIAVVSVFMVVGGVVIMNIMLAVVTERTHEIGIRKSVGARKRDILNQFLVESSMLAASGGVFGVLVAWSLAVIVRSTTPVPMSVPATAVVVAVTLSAAVGLFFGIYPARRAALLDPIEALRAEK